MRRGAQARSTKQQARIDRYEEVKAQAPDLDRPQMEIGLAGSRLGRTVIELEKVDYAIGGQTYIRNFSYIVLKNDRVGILGPNGTGKTTLLNIISGRLQPTSGTVTIGQTVKIGYFSQTNAEMDGGCGPSNTFARPRISLRWRTVRAFRPRSSWSASCFRPICNGRRFPACRAGRSGGCSCCASS